MRKTLLSFLMVIGIGASASAQIIGVNLAEDDAGVARANQTLLPDDVAGVAGYEQANWNNALFSTGSLSDLIDDSGTPTPATVSWVANNGWGDGAATDDANAGIPNAKLQRGYIDDTGAGDTATVSVSSIPYDVYDLIIYMSSDGYGETHGEFAVNGNVIGNGGTITAWSDAPSLDMGRNVLRVRGLSGDVSVVGTRIGGVTRGSISGVQIVQIPEPTTSVLLIGICAGLLLMRRR